MIYLGIEITDAYHDELMCKQATGGLIQIINDKIYCLFDYENVVNGEIVNISDTDEYKAKVLAEQNATANKNLQAQIDILDTKRIRAIAEPSQKDEQTTWLEYYTSQIQELRSQLT